MCVCVCVCVLVIMLPDVQQLQVQANNKVYHHNEHLLIVSGM